MLNLIRAGAFDYLSGSRTEQFWRCLHSSRDVNAGADWLFRTSREEDSQGGEDSVQKIFQTDL